ncbi:hypothetical protein D3C72_1205350 [compost metagenome]
MIKPIGVPVVFPSKIPERNCTSSSSFRCVTIADCPGFLRDISNWMASKSRVIPDGHPSIMPPKASPCDSPKVVTLNKFPKLFPAIFTLFYNKCRDSHGDLNLIKSSLYVNILISIYS